MKAVLESVVPLIPTGGSLAEALRFYTDQMGFSVLWQSAGGAGIRRDHIAFNLVANDNRSWAENARFSIGVSNLDELYREYRDLPATVGPLEVTPWGRREFHLIVHSGVCLQFYECMKPQTVSGPEFRRQTQPSPMLGSQALEVSRGDA